MKLVYAKGACSLSVHVLLEELGLKYEAICVSLQDKTVLENYTPKSYVPVIVLDNGQVMTEAANILQYISDLHHSKFMPPEGSLERARCVEWLTYVSTELHKNLGALFHKKEAGAEFVNMMMAKIEMRLSFMETHLKKNNFLLGDHYTVADMYAMAILRICQHVDVRLEKFPAVSKYKKMIEGLPTVSRVIKLEELSQVAMRAA